MNEEKRGSTGPRSNSNVDPVLFGFPIFLIGATFFVLLFAPEQASQFIQELYAFLAENLGILYQWGTIAVTVFLGWLCLSRYGNVRLGADDQAPEFSLFSWLSMLFCAGIGAGLMYWAVIEWAYYIEAPPYGVEPRSTEAIEWAASYGIFHWGPAAWCLYCLPTLAIAVPFYRRNLSTLRLSNILCGVFPQGVENRWPARLVDFLFMLALVGGAATSLGLATPMMAAAVGKVFGLEASFGLEVSVLAACVIVFGCSVYLGLERGIRRLSNVNMAAVLALCLYVLIVGPTLFILRMGTNSMGFVFDNFIRMMTWTDPVDRSGFIEDYTVFYWAWWIAYAPFFGLFVARISRGRTVRQVILYMTAFGSLGCSLVYIVFGNYGLHLELTGALPVTEIMKEQGVPTAIVEIFYSLPFGILAVALFAIISVIFAATTYDSASYTLAVAATRRLNAGEHPARWHRVFWAVGLGVLPAAIMFIDRFTNEGTKGQSLDIVKSSTLVVSLPILLLGGVMAWSLLRELRASVDQSSD